MNPYALLSKGFEGELKRAGSAVLLESLPDPCIALEYAGMCGPRQRREAVWLLWQLDRERREWRELARAQSQDWTWAFALRPVAVRALYGPKGPRFDLRTVTERILKVVDAELEELPPEMRPVLLSAINPEIDGRIAMHLD